MKFKTKKIRTRFAGNCLLLVLISTFAIVMLGPNTLLEKDIFFKLWLILLFVSLSIDLYVLSRTGIRVFSLAGMFICFSYLFHFGIVIINAIAPGYDAFEAANPFELYDYVTKKSILYAYITIQLVVIGIIMFNDEKTEIDVRLHAFRLKKGSLKKIAILICTITVPLRIIYNIDAIRTFKESSYIDALNMGYSGVYIQISMFYLIGFILLIIAFRKQKIFVKILVFVEILFLLCEMLSGSRINAVVSIIVILYCYTKVIKDISRKNFIVFFVLGIFFLRVIMAVSVLRNGSEINIVNIVNEMKGENLKILLRVFDEFGWTIYTVCETVKQVPEIVEYGMGSTYFYGLLQMFVNVGGILNGPTQAATYTTSLKNLMAAGGSYIGELYYNFGDFGYLFAIPLGFIVGKFSKIIEKGYENKNYIIVAMTTMPFFYFIIYVRGYFMSLVRGTVWGAIFVWILYKIVNSIKVNRYYFISYY